MFLINDRNVCTKKICHSNIYITNSKFPPMTVNNKFRFKAQDSNLEYLFLETWRFEKGIALFEKKTPLVPLRKPEVGVHISLICWIFSQIS